MSKHTKKVRLLKDCTKVHPKLKQDSVHEIFMEKDKQYIIRIDKLFCGIYKKDTELVINGQRNV
ncbi:hypothetical protein Z959_10100 [Clostridium novyi B str. ATCC 27606]|uniref:Uncharacterized protein n=1 Tax=Clostridium novyi B str. ATCC 27606 TaxID=1443123 RepID=A0AA40M5X0_CLONO|nr:hypothetical protein Z959_10100 [Clostridium novyi B str. ATCC 27606]